MDLEWRVEYGVWLSPNYSRKQPLPRTEVVATPVITTLFPVGIKDVGLVCTNHVTTYGM